MQTLLTNWDADSLYKTLLDNIYDAILVIGLTETGNILNVNKAALNLFGYSFDEITKMNIYDLSLYPEETKKGLGDNVTTVHFNWYKTKQNEHIPVQETISHVHHEGTTIAAVILLDLTEDVKKERTLAISEAKYKAIVEAQAELLCRFTVDGVFTFINKIFCECFNVKYDDFIGKNIDDLAINENDRVFIDDLFKKFESGKHDIQYDYPVKCDEDGSLKWIHWSVSGIRDNESNITEYQAIGFDITDRKNLEQDLFDSNQKYKGILNNLQDGFYQTNIDGNLIFVSQSALEILGYNDRQELLGKHISEVFVDPKQRQVLIQKMALNGGKLYEEYLNVVNKNKKQLLISLNCQFAYDINGKFSGTLGIFKDITKAQQHLKEIAKLYQVVEGLQNGLIIIELDGIISYANNMVLEIAGAPTTESVQKHFIGRKIKSFISFDNTNIFDVIKKVIDSGKWIGEAYFSYGSDEGRVPINIVFSRIFENGSTCIAASFYDTSETRTLEKKIKEQSQMYEELQSEMLILVEEMHNINNRKSRSLLELEEAFAKSVQDFRNAKGGSDSDAFPFGRRI